MKALLLVAEHERTRRRDAGTSPRYVTILKSYLCLLRSEVVVHTPGQFRMRECLEPDRNCDMADNSDHATEHTQTSNKLCLLAAFSRPRQGGGNRV
jgi:hypothetical protein